MANLNDILSLLAAAPSEAAKHELTAAKAALLGIVEGVTEFLPISSTGHLVVTEKLIDVGTHPGAKDAADTYAITIQSGAILAVVVLYWRRLDGDGARRGRSRPRRAPHRERHVHRLHPRGRRRGRAREGDPRPVVRRVADHRRVGGRRCRDPVVRARAARTRASSRARRSSRSRFVRR